MGVSEPGGVVDPDDPAWAAELPLRGGFVDLVASDTHLYVLDRLDAVVVALRHDGSIAGRARIPEAPLRAGLLGADHLWVLSGGRPRLSVLALDDGVPSDAVGIDEQLPARDAAYDAARDVLWTVGPVDRPVRRNTGPIRDLHTAVLGWAGADLRAGAVAPQVRWELPAVVDGTRIAVSGSELLVSATGIDAVARLDPEARTAELTAVGAAPAGLLVHGGAAHVAAQLDGSVWTLPDTRTQVAKPPGTTLPELGERLFSSTALWEGGTTYTCNSCHWDGHTDHRLHPGMREVRWEQTRPLGGVGALSPVFTPGQASSLAGAVEGLVRVLDPRFWEPARDQWWLRGRTLQGPGGPVELSAHEVRRALLAWLAERPVEPGPLRGPLSDEARAGLALFARDCGSCHEPTRSAHGRVRVSNIEVALADGPLPLTAPLWADTGVRPRFTPRGHRIAPLWQLGRGGPFLSDGSAPNLRAVLKRARPHTPAVHGGAGPAAYSPDEIEALRAFLLSL